MIINHNLNAMNAHRQLGMNTVNAGKSMEKLSSGLRINRAGDDAAGLAISEKMRAQIRGLDQAGRNAQDAISLIQTAEGALNETHSILQRMRELAVQASNDTNVKEDRDAIQAEINQLTKEIDRIANTTEFNKQNLLDGSFTAKFQIGANETQILDLSIGKMNSTNLGLMTTNNIESGTTDDKDSTKLADGVYTIDSSKNVVDANGNVVGTYDDTNNKVVVGTTDEIVFLKATLAEGSIITISEGGSKFEVKAALDIANANTNGLSALSPGTYTISGTNVLKDGQLVGTFDGTSGAEKITINGVDIKEEDLGYQDGTLKNGVSFTINGADVSSRDKAMGTISILDKAIEAVSKERAMLGAVQNRLEHTIANLGTSSENLTAAESRIRDVDMAKEMMAFSKNNILAQAAQAMLAQANQQPQGVLQLLR